MGDEGFLDRVYERADGVANHRLYADWATTYDDDLVDNGYAMPDRAADAVADLVTDRSLPVLDVGCGTGLSGRALAARGFTVIDGLDYSEEMLAEAGRAGCYRALRAVDLNRSPIEAPDAAYSAVACVGAFGFGHVEPEALDELIRVTRPGGTIVIGVNEPYWLAGGLSARLSRAAADGVVADVAAERGDHIPGHGVTGWLLSTSVC